MPFITLLTLSKKRERKENVNCFCPANVLEMSHSTLDEHERFRTQEPAPGDLPAVAGTGATGLDGAQGSDRARGSEFEAADLVRGADRAAGVLHGARFSSRSAGLQSAGTACAGLRGQPVTRHLCHEFLFSFRPGASRLAEWHGTGDRSADLPGSDHACSFGQARRHPGGARSRQSLTGKVPRARRGPAGVLREELP